MKSSVKGRQSGRFKFLWWNLEGAKLPRIVRAFIRSKIVIFGFFIISIVIIAALFSPALAPHDPYEQNLSQRLKPPFWMKGGSLEYVLGTDQLGRDVLSRLIYSSRITLIVVVTSVVLAATVGVGLGLIAGFWGGWLDSAIMGVTNFFFSFPYVLLAIALMAVIGPGFNTLILVLGLTSWPIYTRIIRSEVFSIKERDFVEAARALGVREKTILRRHILPNVFNSVLVTATLEVARQIINEAFFSFLGLGVQPPIPSWGNMISDGKQYIFVSWWLITFPGIAIFLTALATNVIGDWLRDVFDPHSVF